MAIVAAVSRADEQVATKADVARLDARITAVQWILGIQTAFLVMLVVRAFGLL